MDNEHLRRQMQEQAVRLTAADVRNNRDLPSARYRREPVFRALVEQMRVFIRMAQYTPSELREAVILAAQIEEMERVTPRCICPDGGPCSCHGAW